MVEQVYWLPVFGEGDEMLTTHALPACCRRSARDHENANGLFSFECPTCGGAWEKVVRLPEGVLGG
jgi:hypothetical protein